MRWSSRFSCVQQQYLFVTRQKAAVGRHPPASVSWLHRFSLYQLRNKFPPWKEKSGCSGTPEHFMMFLKIKSLVLCCHIFSRTLQMALWDNQSLMEPRGFPGGCGSLFIHPHLAECSPSIFLSFVHTGLSFPSHISHLLEMFLMQPCVFLLVHLPSGKLLTFHCIVSIFQVLLSKVS